MTWFRQVRESLRSEACRPWPMKRWSNSSLQRSGHRPEGFCCSVMVRHDGCHYSEVDERSVRRAVYAHRGAQAVLERDTSVRQVTAVEGDTPSKVHDVTMLIDAAHRHACIASVRTQGSRAIKRESVAIAHRRVWPWCREARRALSCDENDQFRSTLATSCSC